MLTCDNITVARGSKPLLTQLGFCLAPGGFLLLKGENGSGKTTLMRVLAGEKASEAGRVLWQGKPVRGNPAFRQARIFIGHRNTLGLHRTVQGQLSTWARAGGTLSMVPAALYYFGLADKADTRCFRLSAGWRRRVALARLLLSQAPLWLLDEPSNFLDHEAVTLLNGLIETRVRNGGMVIVASHSMQSSFDAHTLNLEDFSPLKQSRPEDSKT